MSKKNTLGAKRQRKASRSKDRGYPEFYTKVTNGKYSKLVATKVGTKVDNLKKLFAKMHMDITLGMLGIFQKPEVVEGEIV